MKKINFRSILVNVLTAISIGALAACSNGAITPSTVDNSGSNTTSNMVEKSEAQAPEQDETCQAIDELDTSSSIEELLTAEEVSLTENCLLIETDTGFKMAMDYPGSLNKKGIFIVDSQYGIDRSDTQPPVVNASRGERLASTITSGDHLFLYPTTNQKYYSFDITSTATNYYNAEEINGIAIDGSPESMRSALVASGDISIFEGDENVLLAESPTSFTYGSFQGSKWIEETVNLDCLVWATTVTAENDYEERIAIEEEKTKEGYSFIDLSTVKPGCYVFSASNDMYEVLSVLIEIR